MSQTVVRAYEPTYKLCAFQGTLRPLSLFLKYSGSGVVNRNNLFDQQPEEPGESKKRRPEAYVRSIPRPQLRQTSHRAELVRKRMNCKCLNLSH